jgi:hypothetical protein
MIELNDDSGCCFARPDPDVRLGRFGWNTRMRSFKIIFLFVGSIVLGVWYLALGLKARAHLNETAASSDRSIGWLFWWSFDIELYDEEGQKMCEKGQLLAVPIIMLTVAWNVVLL